MTRILLATLLFAAMTVAEPAALQSRPPGLDLTGARLAALDAQVRQAEQAIADNRLTKDGRGGPAAQTLLEGVLTADPFHAGALAAMERLIQALAAHAQGKLAQQPPDLEGARAYADKALEVAAAYRGAAVEARLTALYSAIAAQGAEAARSQGSAARAGEIASLEQALAAAQQARDRPPAPGQVVKPASVNGPLRSEAQTLSANQVGAMLREKGMFDRHYNPQGPGYPNEFLDNGDGTVTDRASGLMWQQGGSAGYMSYADAQDYVKQLNRERFAGHGDWRLPTLEEAASLLEPKPLNGDLYIDPVFDATQPYIWTADEVEGSAAVWLVHFSGGRVFWFFAVLDSFVRVCRASGQ